MIWLRLARTVCALGLLTLLLAPWQALAHASGRLDPTRAPRLWYRLAARILRLRVQSHGAPDRQRPLLIVSNHISWTDVIVLGSLFHGSFIAKAEVEAWPIVGPLSRLQGTILVDRLRKRSAGGQVGALALSLAGGRAMLLFAEGTTSDGTTLLPFKSTLFGAASLALAEASRDAVLIQPVSIAYTGLGGLPMGRGQRLKVSWMGDEALWPHLMRLLSLPPVDVEVRWGEPIPFTAGSDRKQVAHRVRDEVGQLFARSLGRLPSPRPDRRADRLVEADGESR